MNDRGSLFDDIYSISTRRLNLLKNDNILREGVEETVLKTLEFLKIKKEDFLDFNVCIDEIFKNLNVKTSKQSVIVDNENHINWYNNSNTRPYWDSYKQWLLEYKKLPLSVVNSVDKSTDEILSLLENPTRDGNWDRRGMVVGHVQSGKTTNFIGLCNKALDSGYKFIVVLSGLTNDLRKQTHERLDQGFFGYNTEFLGEERVSYNKFSSNQILQLGKIREASKLNRPITFTHSGFNGDLNSVVLKHANIHVDYPILFCIKKNKTSLENLIKYIISSPTHTRHVQIKEKPFSLKVEGNFPVIDKFPILVIDDEVDQASVDTGLQDFNNDTPDEEYDPKTINRLIRTLLNVFYKKSYIGYTATPFSNIFIHPKAETMEEGPDLFPKSFICDLPEPSNYIGLKQLFNDEGEFKSNYIEIINDHCLYPNEIDCSEGWIPPKHNKDHKPKYDNEENLPNSLKDAILQFIISCSIRNLRGEIIKHKSMLIHVSKYINVNFSIYKDVVSYLDKIRSHIINPGDLNYIGLVSDIKNNIKKLINEEFSDNQIDDLINSEYGVKFVISDISLNIKNLSGNTNDSLDYEKFFKKKQRGIQTIVIGGDRLSRGITLEGLSISYFLRTSKMYDTLMQMSRWLGYNADFKDVSKLFITEDLIDWFLHISTATDELRGQFKIMSEKNLTPLDFGLKVKSHPLLMVTSRVKMRHGLKFNSTFLDHFSQTTSFDINQIDHNLKIVENLINKIGSPKEKNIIKRPYGNENYSYFWENIDSDLIIEFFNKYKVHKDAKTVMPHNYSIFIKNMNSIGELTNWSIGLMGGGSSDIFFNVNNIYKINALLRKPRQTSYSDKFNIGVLTNPNHQMLDLSDDIINKIIDKSQDNESYGRYARSFRSEKNGLLLIYPILGIFNLAEYINFRENNNHNNQKIVYGFAVSFPNSSKSNDSQNKLTYIVNNVYYAHENS
jgi:hypothetical protein